MAGTEPNQHVVNLENEREKRSYSSPLESETAKKANMTNTSPGSDSSFNDLMSTINDGTVTVSCSAHTHSTNNAAYSTPGTQCLPPVAMGSQPSYPGYQSGYRPPRSSTTLATAAHAIIAPCLPAARRPQTHVYAAGRSSTHIHTPGRPQTHVHAAYLPTNHPPGAVRWRCYAPLTSHLILTASHRPPGQILPTGLPGFWLLINGV